MIKLETRVLLGHLLEQGLSKAAIPRKLDINRRTINRWIAEGQTRRRVRAAAFGREAGSKKIITASSV